MPFDELSHDIARLVELICDPVSLSSFEAPWLQPKLDPSAAASRLTRKGGIIGRGVEEYRRRGREAGDTAKYKLFGADGIDRRYSVYVAPTDPSVARPVFDGAAPGIQR
jgi:hypothetical protein